MRKILLATLPLLLTACVNDSATYYAGGGNEHTLSLRRQQTVFWSDDAKVTVLAARLPDCQRLIDLTEMPVDEVDLELFSGGDNQWSLRSATQVWHVETQGCTLTGESSTVAGDKVGVFKVEGDKLVFEAAANVPGTGPAAAGAETPAPEPAPAN
ncbi:MAG: hypothetical protein V4724_38930 [Pseudomonadota bacterium]